MSDRALGRALLARQLLLERSQLPVTAALEHLVGMQAQEPRAPYVGLWSRLEGFDPRELSELVADRRAVRGVLMRCTVHLVSERDWTLLRPLMRAVLERSLRSSPFGRALRNLDFDALARSARGHLSHTALARRQIGDLLAADWPGVDPASLAQAATVLCPAIQVPPRGLWRLGGQARWMASESWLARGLDHRPDLEAVIIRYLAAFGPASVTDIQAWCGLTKLAASIAGLRDRLSVYTDDRGRELFDLPGAPLPDPDTPAPPPHPRALRQRVACARRPLTHHQSSSSCVGLARSPDAHVPDRWRCRRHVEPHRRPARACAVRSPARARPRRAALRGRAASHVCRLPLGQADLIPGSGLPSACGAFG